MTKVFMQAAWRWHTVVTVLHYLRIFFCNVDAKASWSVLFSLVFIKLQFNK
jgi:hypothetical protein